MHRRPRHRRSDRHEPRSGGQLDRPGRRRLQGGRTQQHAASRCCAPATSSSRCASRTSTASAGPNLGADQPRPGRLDAPAHAGQRAADRDRPDRQRGGRLAGAGIEGVARIWARRLFGSTLDYVMPVSAETFDGAPIADDADAPSVAVSWLGQADVAYRQSAGPGSPLPGPRIFLNILPNGESDERRRVPGREHRRQRGARWRSRPPSGRRASTSTKRKTCACCMTRTARRA